MYEFVRAVLLRYICKRFQFFSDRLRVFFFLVCFIFLWIRCRILCLNFYYRYRFVWFWFCVRVVGIQSANKTEGRRTTTRSHCHITIIIIGSGGGGGRLRLCGECTMNLSNESQSRYLCDERMSHFFSTFSSFHNFVFRCCCYSQHALSALYSRVFLFWNSQTLL